MKKVFFNSICRVAEDQGWTVKDETNDLSFSKYSPAGEDCYFTVTKPKEGEDYVDVSDLMEFLAEKINDLYEGFDPDEHAVEWFQAGNGAPHNLQVLLDDAKEIEKMLDELHTAFNEYIPNIFDEEADDDGVIHLTTSAFSCGGRVVDETKWEVECQSSCSDSEFNVVATVTESDGPYKVGTSYELDIPNDVRIDDLPDLIIDSIYN